jgi:hypothetical protein
MMNSKEKTMSDNAAVEFLDRIRKETLADSKDDLATVRKNSTPQFILALKMMSSELEDGEERKACVMNGEFGFTEKLVNDLMHFAYLQGIKRGKSSMQYAVNQGRDEMLEKMFSFLKDNGLVVGTGDEPY